VNRIIAAILATGFAASAGRAQVAPADIVSPPADAAKSASGLISKVVTPGAGTEKPTPTDVVTVHYTGWSSDGKMFDSSLARGMPATLSLDDVIRGWTEGVQMMVEGERTRFWIPENLAYKGEAGSPKGMLVFDIDLINVQ
jgi:peptidylprolyl isomerase